MKNKTEREFNSLTKFTVKGTVSFSTIKKIVGKIKNIFKKNK